MDAERILEILPHRYPFLLVDKVIEISDLPESGQRVGRTIKAIKNVTINEPFFTGHFPGRPIMPGVLIVEAMAQASALLCYRPIDPELKISIASIKEARFRVPVVPGDTLELHARVLKDRGQMVLLDNQVYVQGRLVAEAQILASLIPKDKQS
ncbi:MAG: 3-hydroxyacyl-[acyl-carrier-protein] dehydratase FabZ [Bdellovibrio sp.]|nr:MAG: 3-hydroxyacyl-[acyl-carrier-protein] dehydratase FabZ [Bdellovibrio sp.]